MDLDEWLFLEICFLGVNGEEFLMGMVVVWVLWGEGVRGICLLVVWDEKRFLWDFLGVEIDMFVIVMVNDYWLVLSLKLWGILDE